MSSWVLDASVAAKWFLPVNGETLVEEANAVLQAFAGGRTTLLVPGLFWVECGSILRRAARVQRISIESAAKAIAILTQLGIETAQDLPLLEAAFAIAASFNRTLCDSTYVALAVSSGRPLLTADEKLANSLGTQFPIRWLGSMEV